MKSVRFYVGAQTIANLYWAALRLADCLGPWEDAWLWLDDANIWNRQGLHLYTRLRLSYGDARLISEAPVHQFYGFEAADLASFIAVALANEWSFSVITSHNYGQLFVTASSGVEAWVSKGIDLSPLIAALSKHGISTNGEFV